MFSARFDLTDLQLFLAVLEHGSLTGGAKAMHLALASASQRISGMESELGAPLFERMPRGVRSTAAGDALARHARSILAQVEQMHGDLRAYGAGNKGTIRLLSNTAGLAVFLPDKLCGFLTEHPDLSVDIAEQPSHEIALALAENRADLGLVADIADLTALQTRLILQDQLVVVASRRHRINGQLSVRFADIVDEAFVGLSDAALEVHLTAHAARLGRRMQYRIRLRSAEKLSSFLEAGIGIAILPQACAAELHRAELCIAGLAEPWAARKLHLCAQNFQTLTPHARLLARHLTNAAQAES